MKKMGKVFIAGTAMAVTALSLSGCFIPQASVYGPPPTEVESAVEPASTGDGQENETIDLNETTGFDVESEISGDVYGPAPYFESDPADSAN